MRKITLEGSDLAHFAGCLPRFNHDRDGLKNDLEVMAQNIRGSPGAEEKARRGFWIIQGVSLKKRRPEF